MDEASYQGSDWIKRVITPTVAGGSMASRHRRHGLPASRMRSRACTSRIPATSSEPQAATLRAALLGTVELRTACVLKISNQIEDFLRIFFYGCSFAVQIYLGMAAAVRQAVVRSRCISTGASMLWSTLAGHVADGCFNGAALWHEF